AIDVQALLQSHAPRAPEHLRARVAELAPAPRGRHRLVFVVVPVAVALAVAAAIVHGIAGSGTNKVAVDHGAAVQRSLGRAGTPTWTTATATGAGPAAPALLAPNVGGNGSRLQHTEASLQVRVPDVKRLGAVTSAATRIATSLGGYAQSVVYRTPE